MIAVPTHSGTVDSTTAETLLQAQRVQLGRGQGFETRFHSGAVISTLRNVIVADFLGSTADVLLMLDSDQGISGQALERMISCDALVTGCIYPRRRFDWGRVDRTQTAAGLERILYQAMDFVGELDRDAEGRAEVQDGFARALNVGTGVLLIRRPALETMMSRLPELEGTGFHTQEFPPPRFRYNFGFFNPSPGPDGVPQSEDFSFCSRWRACGGEIWADVSSPVAHVGRQVFAGSYLDFVRATGTVQG
jgi:hypothetical protein